jgi:hypothetical protein
MRPQAHLLRQAGVRVATAATTFNVEEPEMLTPFRLLEGLAVRAVRELWP